MKKRISQVMVLIMVMTILITQNSFSVIAAKKIKSKSVEMNVTNVTLAVGDIATISAIMKPANSTDSLKWSVSDKAVATVNKYGVVTAVKAGSTTVTVKTSSKKTAKCTVTVKEELTKEEVEKLIASKVLTEDRVKEIIKENTLSENQLINLIKSNSITEKQIIELINSNMISEEEVKRLIDQYSLSEDDVQKIVKESSDNQDDEWKDGQELTLYNQNALPASSEHITITDVKVKKYHCDEIKNDCKQLYKYVATITGSGDLWTVYGEEEDGYKWIESETFHINLLSTKGIGNSFVYCFLEKTDYDISYFPLKCDYHVEISDGSFIITATWYNIFADYDLFDINPFEKGTRDDI